MKKCVGCMEFLCMSELISVRSMVWKVDNSYIVAESWADKSVFFYSSKSIPTQNVPLL